LKAFDLDGRLTALDPLQTLLRTESSHLPLRPAQ